LRKRDSTCWPPPIFGIAACMKCRAR
jgi:hypothetical protein